MYITSTHSTSHPRMNGATQQRKSVVSNDNNQVVSNATAVATMLDDGEKRNNATPNSSTPSLLVQPELIPTEYKKKHGITCSRGHLEQHWLCIYSYVQPSYTDRIKLKQTCRLFKNVENIIQKNPKCSPLNALPNGRYTSYPHPNYLTLNNLMQRLSFLAGQDDSSDSISTLPQYLFIEKGRHVISDNKNGQNTIVINYPIAIIGSSHNDCVIEGGLKIYGKEENIATTKDVTLTGSRKPALPAYTKASTYGIDYDEDRFLYDRMINTYQSMLIDDPIGAHLSGNYFNAAPYFY